MTDRIRIAILAAALLGIATLAQAGEVYTWKDAKGVTHYSDAPPPKGQYHAKARAMDEAAPAAQPAPAPAAKPAAAPALPPPPTVARNAAPAIDPALAQSNCTAAKINLERLKSGAPVGVDENGDGQPDVVMSTEDVAKETSTAQGQIDTFCGSAGTP